MRKLALLAVLALVLLASGVAVAKGNDRITVCHVHPGDRANAHTISVNRRAWEEGHSPHNSHILDYERECEPYAEPPTPEPTEKPKPTKDPVEVQGELDQCGCATWIGVCDSPIAETQTITGEHVIIQVIPRQ